MPGKRSSGSTIDRVQKLAEHKKKGLLDRIVSRVVDEGKDAVSFPIRAAMDMSGMNRGAGDARKSPLVGKQATWGKKAVESQLPPASTAGLLTFVALGGLDAVGEGGAKAMYSHWGKHSKMGIVPLGKEIPLASGRKLVRVRKFSDNTLPHRVNIDKDEGFLSYTGEGTDLVRSSYYRTPHKAGVAYNLKEGDKTLGSVALSADPHKVYVEEVYLKPAHRGPSQMKDLFSVVLDYADKNPADGTYKRYVDASLANMGIAKLLSAFQKRDPKFRVSEHLEASMEQYSKERNMTRQARLALPKDQRSEFTWRTQPVSPPRTDPPAWAHSAPAIPDRRPPSTNEELRAPSVEDLGNLDDIPVDIHNLLTGTRAGTRPMSAGERAVREGLDHTARRNDVIEMMRRRPHNGQNDVRDVHWRDDERVSVTLQDGTPWNLEIEDWRMIRNLMNVRNLSFSEAQHAYGQILARRRGDGF